MDEKTMKVLQETTAAVSIDLETGERRYEHGSWWLSDNNILHYMGKKNNVLKAVDSTGSPWNTMITIKNMMLILSEADLESLYQVLHARKVGETYGKEILVRIGKIHDKK